MSSFNRYGYKIYFRLYRQNPSLAGLPFLLRPADLDHQPDQRDQQQEDAWGEGAAVQGAALSDETELNL